MTECCGIGIIGLGRLGASLYKALNGKTKYGITTYTRSGNMSLQGLVECSATIFVCVNDDSLEEIAEEIACVSDDLSGKIFIHFSGLKTSAVFQPLKEKGAGTASLHPLQTFPTKDSQANFIGARFAVEGDDIACRIDEILADLNPRITRIDPAQKTRYHAAAVFSSNLLCVVCQISDRLLKDAGISEGIKIHEGLIKTTIDGIMKYGPEEALTGPAVRGDLSTMIKHLEVLNDSESGIYIGLTMEALRTGEKKGRISNKRRISIEKELLRKRL